MSKSLDEASKSSNESNEVKNQKNLCVHDLKQKLRVKKKKEFIKNTIILSVIIFFFGTIFILVYQKV